MAIIELFCDICLSSINQKDLPSYILIACRYLPSLSISALLKNIFDEDDLIFFLKRLNSLVNISTVYKYLPSSKYVK